MREKPRDQIWQAEARRNLQEWYVDYHKMLFEISETKRKEPDPSAYKPSGTSAQFSVKSPYNLHSKKPSQTHRCAPRKNKKDNDGFESSDDESSDDANDDDSPSRRVNPRLIAGPSRSEPSSSIISKKPSRDAHRNRPYCTQRCLLGLLEKRLLNANCPNLECHADILGHHSIDRINFLNLIQKQLALSLDIDCSP